MKITAEGDGEGQKESGEEEGKRGRDRGRTFKSILVFVRMYFSAALCFVPYPPEPPSILPLAKHTLELRP